MVGGRNVGTCAGANGHMDRAAGLTPSVGDEMSQRSAAELATGEAAKASETSAHATRWRENSLDCIRG